MSELATRYLGLQLRSPIVASASPLTGDVATAREIEDAGAGAIVLPSLFEEEILHDDVALNRSLEAGAHHVAEASDYFPDVAVLPSAGERYLGRLAEIKSGAGVPVIASLNATSPSGWSRYAADLQDAGADALELNLYHVAADPTIDGEAVEVRDLEIVRAVRAALAIPLAVKLSPYYSSMANVARRIVDAGADGLVLFNRFYQPDVDLDVLDVVPRIELSRPAELRLPLRWIAILRPQLGSTTSLAATSGVHHGDDVVKALMVGADVAMVTSALLARGPSHVRVLEDQVVAWMIEHGYASVDELRGSATSTAVADPAAFERANYVRTLHSWSSPSN